MNNGARRNHSSCGSNQQQYEPFMLGSSRGGIYSSFRTPQQMASANTMSAPSTQYMPPGRTSSMNDQTTSVRECMYWPASLNYRRNAPQVPQTNMYSTNQNQAANPAGDFMYASAPPKVYFSGPGGQGLKQQNIPCQIAPLGTDPSSLIKPLQPLTVRVQAPADLFTGDPSQPKTISISPAQLYGGGGR